MPRRNPEDIDLGAIKTDLEFLIERVERLRKEQALKPLYVMVGSAGLVLSTASSTHVAACTGYNCWSGNLR
jgi:hypothetical protein